MVYDLLKPLPPVAVATLIGNGLRNTLSGKPNSLICLVCHQNRHRHLSGRLSHRCHGQTALLGRCQ